MKIQTVHSIQCQIIQPLIYGIILSIIQLKAFVYFTVSLLFIPYLSHFNESNTSHLTSKAF